MIDCGLGACAVVTMLLVPGWLARRTRRPASWLTGVIPALLALGIAVAELDGW